MSAYFEVIKNSFQRRFVYRADTFIRIISNLLRLFVFVSIWTALFASGNPGNLTLREMFTYLVVAELINTITESRVGPRISDSIGDGSVVIDFLRPMSFKYYHFANDFGENIYRLIFNSLPTCILVAMIWGFALPSNVLVIIIFFISLFFGIIISYHIDYIFTLFAFWIKRSSYLDRVSKSLFMLFSGSVVPIWFYPDSLKSASLILPFSYVTFQPLTIFLEKNTIHQSLMILVYQSMWILALIIVEKIIWIGATKQVTVNGG